MLKRTIFRLMLLGASFLISYTAFKPESPTFYPEFESMPVSDQHPSGADFDAVCSIEVDQTEKTFPCSLRLGEPGKTAPTRTSFTPAIYVSRDTPTIEFR